MIDIRKLKELVRLMVENDLTELDLKDQEETVTVKRGSPVIMQSGGAVPMPAYVPPRPAVATGGSDDEAAEGGESASGSGATAGASASTAGLVAIESPMVGTFYSAPNPDTPPFVTPGATVSDATTVCLIEAMKVFNEIKAERSGTIERVLVKNGDAVEFGQKLFLVRPS